MLSAALFCILHTDSSLCCKCFSCLCRALLLLLLDMRKGVCLPTSAFCCQAENEALQQLVLEVAQNKQEAQRKVGGLKQKYSNLLAKVSSPHRPHCLSSHHCNRKHKRGRKLAAAFSTQVPEAPRRCFAEPFCVWAAPLAHCVPSSGLLDQALVLTYPGRRKLLMHGQSLERRELMC